MIALFLIISISMAFIIRQSFLGARDAVKTIRGDWE